MNCEILLLRLRNCCGHDACFWICYSCRMTSEAFPNVEESARSSARHMAARMSHPVPSGFKGILSEGVK
jgi:hypothetical protein